jgi:hypothetical protein
MSEARTVAFVRDLMDRSRLGEALGTVEFGRTPSAAAGAAVVVVDLASFGDQVAGIRAAAPDALIVGFGPHVDDDLLARARADGVDRVLPRSRFFRDPAAAVT